MISSTPAPTPVWLKAIGREAKRKGLNKLSMRQIDAEIAAARSERRKKLTDTQREGFPETSSKRHRSTI